MIRIRNLSKSYDGRSVLKAIDLDLYPGELVMVVGASGSGKSVLLRCIGLKEQWDRGELHYRNVDMKKANPWQYWKLSKDWAVLQQSPQLYKGLSAYRNVVYGRLRDFPLWRVLLGGKASEDEYMRAMDYLQSVGLLDKAHQKVEKLSGGEKQRVAIAKALNKGAKILIADEPVSNLDPHAAERVLDGLRKLCEKERIIAVVAMQNLEMAERFAARLIGMADGRIEVDIRGRRLTHGEKIKLNL
jgi:phosphonate transport system ATP-binding protein